MKDLLSLMHGRSGHFQLESGLHGELWLDLDTVFVRPNIIQPFIEELATKLSSYDYDGLCGALTGGAFVAYALAVLTKKEFYFTERITEKKDGKFTSVLYTLPQTLKKSVQNKKIIVIDDVVNAGSATKGTIKSLEENNAQIVATAALLVLGDKANEFTKEKGIGLEYILKESSRTWSPNDCPLCKGNVPLENLVP